MLGAVSITPLPYQKFDNDVILHLPGPPHEIEWTAQKSCLSAMKLLLSVLDNIESHTQSSSLVGHRLFLAFNDIGHNSHS